jgi:ATP-dependent Lhr-like helicase
MLRTVRTVIVDEIHAVIGTRRGAHLALSLERLQKIAQAPLLRLGLSATQKPIEEVARYLAGGPAPVTIVDEGHRRTIDLALEIPKSPLDAVMSHEVWEEYYDRLLALIASHQTTIVFVNTRRMAERIARELSDRLGEDAVTAHHGSLSKDKRLDAETRLKSGRLKALVATASLELGIDIGHVDLVCQIGSPHRIATVLQRVGRSGHTIAGLPKGRLFPASRDDLIECVALLRSIGRGELDAIVSHDTPLDVLAQQIVAECACDEYGEDAMFELVRGAWPFRELQRSDFDAVLAMLSDGFSTRRGRRAALVHRDEVNGRIRGRRASRLLALTSGGAIPEVADYRVILEPEDTFIGTLNEDFAIESAAGDIFQLGNASWQVLQVGAGVVRVADAKGAPPTIPFWLGEAPGRSDELSRAVSDLRSEIDRRLGPASSDPDVPSPEDHVRPTPEASTIDWLVADGNIDRDAAEQAVAYLAAGRRVLGVLPTQETLVLERFFDESGGMQLVLHAPFGSRVNKAWGLALRKRFCRQFNFELQAAATEDALLLSLGPQHSFPLTDVFRYLHPATTRDVLVQAFLDAPVFQTRWRWNTTISLAVPRNRGGRKVPPQLQRMLADDLMAAVFPDAAACLENIPGDRQIPDHPLVGQTIRDCLQEAMDFDGLIRVLQRIHGGEIRCVGRDTPEPSVLTHEILNARPYAFLDDAPLEERRTQAVQTRRAGDAGGDIGALDAAAIARVRDEARPAPRDADELHDVLLTVGFLSEVEAAACAEGLTEPLVSTRRIGLVSLGGTPGCWVTAERLPEIRVIHPTAAIHPDVVPPLSRRARQWVRADAIVEMIRGRLTIAGPTTALKLGMSMGISEDDAEAALVALESEGAVLRGRFTPSSPSGGAVLGIEWCDRGLLARIHRYTLNRLRAEIEAVSPADFMRFLFVWQHAHPSSKLTGPDGLRMVLATLDGFELAASAWERAVLPARMDRYDPAQLDVLCLTGEIGWARLSAAPTRLVSGTRVALFLRQHEEVWQSLRARDDETAEQAPVPLSAHAERTLEALRSRGASFFPDLMAATDLSDEDLRSALGELVALGHVSSDGFAGLREILHPHHEQRPRSAHRHSAGRWSILRTDGAADVADDAAEVQARVFLRRYGVVFRRLLTREANALPWRVLARIYRRLEARGEIRGGRFVNGMSGEQFALPDAVDRLREVRRTAKNGTLITISAADPLNLTGIVTTGERVRPASATRLVYQNGVPLAVMEGAYVRQLTEVDAAIAADVTSALAGRRMPAVLSGFVGR